MKKIIIISVFITIGVIEAIAAGHTVNISSTNAICFGACNGSATATVTGGVGPFTYTWTNAAASQTITNLCAGNYSVTVTDQNDLSTTTASVTINQPQQMVLSSSSINTVCGLNNGEVSVIVSGGTPAFLYQWSNGSIFPQVIGLPVGTYTITVTDANLCTAVASVTIAANPVLVISNITTVSSNCGLCDGTATPNVSGGNPPFTYLWSNGDNSFQATGLCTGFYSLSVVDVNGCMASDTCNINNTGGFELVLDTLINANCANNTFGSITVHAIGGGGGYTYLWSPGGETTPTISNLAAGYYSVLSTESGGCTDSVIFQIGSSANIYASIVNTSDNCVGNGTATINVTGINPPFSYLWSNGQTTPTAINLSHATYYVTITDNIGCNIVAYTVINGICVNIINGRVYNDINQNCIQDVGELGISGKGVVAIPGNFYGYTDSNGDYTIQTTNLNNVVSVYMNIVGISPTCPNPSYLNVNFSQIGDTLGNNNFGYFSDPNYFDLRIFHSWTGANPGFTKLYRLNGNNNSPTPQNAIIRLTYDPLLQYTSSTFGGIHNLTLHTVEWSATNISPFTFWNSGQVLAYFYVPTSVSITDSLCSLFEIFPIVGDYFPSNNTRYFCQPVTGSYDPNSKDVIPLGYGSEGFITNADSVLYYTVHFQNTGNDTAFTVVVVDTLSQYVEPGTIVPGASSHPYAFTLSEHGILTFRFDNILLPDSNVNEPGSNGYFNYTVNLKPNLPVGTVIENKAFIFFDFNLPIVTNTTTNTIASPMQIDELTATTKVNVYPNPFKNITTFEIQTDKVYFPYVLEVYDMLGKKVKSLQNINTSIFKFSSNDLESGIYLYKVLSSEKEMGKGKIIIE